MGLNSKILKGNARLEAVAAGGPSVKERPAEYADPEAVKCIQEGLKKLGYVGQDGKPLEIDGKYGQNTYFAVKSFQTVAFQGDWREIDGRVGFKTIGKLDAALPKGDSPPPPPPPPPTPEIQTEAILVFFSGMVVPGGDEVTGAQINPTERGWLMFHPMKALAAANARRLFKAFQGSKDTQKGVEAAADFIVQNFAAGTKVVVYGYSAGGSNALDLSRAVDKRNAKRKEEGKPPARIRMLVTMDAAVKDGSDGVRREVAGSVEINANYWQTKTLNTSRGGPNVMIKSEVDGNTAKYEPHDVTESLKVGVFESGHAAIERQMLPLATADVNRGLA